MKYLTPTFKGDFVSFDKAQFRQQVNQAKQRNQGEYEAAVSLYNDIMKQARILYGAKSKQVKYLEREQPKKPPDLERKSWKPVIRQYEAWCDTEARRERRRINRERRAEAKMREEEAKRQKYQDYRRRVAETNELLQEHGYEPDEHYKPTSAITFAKKVLIECNGEILPVRGLPEPKGQ